MTANVVSRLELPSLQTGSASKTSVLGERMDLVGHVKVKLVVTLGGAELSIDKLFALSNNDVVVLDRQADAPVDVRLNDKVIARGALVAVGDKFGVRITELHSEA
jgi:flagellar motor switch protein FliN/FliY